MTTPLSLLPTHAALDWLAPQCPSPIFSTLTAQDRVLNCPVLDAQLFTQVLGRPYPKDMLGSPQGRLRALEPVIPYDTVVFGFSALWVHTGSFTPSVLSVASTGRLGRWRGIDAHTARIPEKDCLDFGYARCCTLPRATVDIVRTASPQMARKVIGVALDHGASFEQLQAALYRSKQAPGVVRAHTLLAEFAPEPEHTC